jgi:hypothetical protein
MEGGRLIPTYLIVAYMNDVFVFNPQGITPLYGERVIKSWQQDLFSSSRMIGSSYTPLTTPWSYPALSHRMLGTLYANSRSKAEKRLKWDIQ